MTTLREEDKTLHEACSLLRQIFRFASGTSELACIVWSHMKREGLLKRLFLFREEMHCSPVAHLYNHSGPEMKALVCATPNTTHAQLTNSTHNKKF